MDIHVIRAGPNNPETFLAAKLYFTFKFSPSRHTRISSPIPTWQRSRSKSVCVCGHQSQLPLPYSSSRVQVPMPPSIRRRSIVLKVPLSRARMRLAENNRIRLQIEQLRCRCESVDPLDDTCDARWISLISGTVRHVFDSQNQRDTWQQRKVKGPEPGAMRNHVGCVHKHLNHGTEEKQTRTTRAS